MTQKPSANLKLSDSFSQRLKGAITNPYGQQRRNILWERADQHLGANATPEQMDAVYKWMVIPTNRGIYGSAISPLEMVSQFPQSGRYIQEQQDTVLLAATGRPVILGYAEMPSGPVDNVLKNIAQALNL